MGQFTGKTVIVTGGSAGTGRATALELARHGAAVVVGDAHAPEGTDLEQDLTRPGGRGLFLRAVIAREED